MKVFLIIFVAAAMSSTAKQTSTEVLRNVARLKAIDSAVDCGLRLLAFEYAKKVLSSSQATSNFKEPVYAALALENCTSYNRLFPAETVERKPLVNPSADVNYYVSDLTGSNTNPGTTIDKPFKTISAAQNAIRLHHPLQSRPRINIYVRKGVYFDALALDALDSGRNDDNKITYQAYENEHPVISGGIDLKLSWTQTGRIWKATVPKFTSFNSLYVYGLHKNNTRLIRARWPNGNPLIPGDGYAPSKGSYKATEATGEPFETNAFVTSSASHKELSCGSIRPLNTNFSTTVAYPTAKRESWADFRAYRNGTIHRFNTSFNYPFWNTNVPMGLYFDSTNLTKRWAHPETGVLHTFHSNGWGGWQFDIETLDVKEPTMTVFHFRRGGFQEARGSGSIGGKPFYVENILEELDSPNEWFLDEVTSTLYVIPDNETNLESVHVVGAVSESALLLLGSQDDPIHDVTFRGFTFTHTATSFMSDYEVPSGGDWSIHRGATVFADGAERIAVVDCTFDQPGGNGAVFSRYVRNSTVSGCEFYACGDSAVALVGATELMNGTAGSYPAYNTIERNHIHDFGIFGKQTSGYFKGIARANVVRENVIYNGPRAGVNFNDGFAGGEVLEGNLIFNMVRETSDHGAFNSWDRQPWLWSKTDMPGSDLELSPATHQIKNNFIFNTNFLGISHGLYCIDHDDGSSQYNDTGNVLVYGGIKYRDGVNKSASGNLVVYSLGAAFQVNGFLTDSFFDNTVILNGGPGYTCVGNAVPGVTTMENRFFTPTDKNTTFRTSGCEVDGTTLKEWQRGCKCDQDSTISSDVTSQEIVSMASKLLGLNV